MIPNNWTCTLLFLFFPSALGGSYGVPRVHYKGRQGDYYVMVWFLLILSVHFCIFLVYLSILCFCNLVCSKFFARSFCNLMPDLTIIYRLWTCWGLVYGMLGILQVKREYAVTVITLICHPPFSMAFWLSTSIIGL